MSRFRDKLAKLRPGVGGRPAPVAPQTDLPTAGQPAGQEAATEPAHGAGGVVDLDALGRQLQQMVGPAARPVAPTEPQTEDWRLPFRRGPGGRPDGSPLRALVRLDQCTGSVPLGAVLGADEALLALLALTPELASCRVANALYLDTETTGLGGSGSVAFLVGLAWYDAAEQAFVLEQHFLAELGEEASLLDAVAARIASADFVVSYNGKSFDLPMLKTRLVMNRLPPLPERPQLDLLHMVRRVHRSRPWRKSLTSAEQHVLRFDRGPDVPGEEVAQRYLHYLRAGDETGLRQVLQHNVQDVVSLVALTGIYGEPLDRLEGNDLADVARVMRRAGALEQAAQVVERAHVDRPGPYALRARAEIAKARGDKRRALADYEALAAEVDDAVVRLELAKLYEHYLKAPGAALQVAREGTAESPEAQARRQARLERQVARRGERSGKGR